MLALESSLALDPLSQASDPWRTESCSKSGASPWRVQPLPVRVWVKVWQTRPWDLQDWQTRPWDPLSESEWGTGPPGNTAWASLSECQSKAQARGSLSPGPLSWRAWVKQEVTLEAKLHRDPGSPENWGRSHFQSLIEVHWGCNCPEDRLWVVTESYLRCKECLTLGCQVTMQPELCIMTWVWCPPWGHKEVMHKETSST